MTVPASTRSGWTSKQPDGHRPGMITFYFSPGSSSLATHIALNEVGASFEARPLTLQKGTRAPDFLKVNPNGKVPTLVVDGTILTEVAATLFYLARTFPQAGL